MWRTKTSIYFNKDTQDIQDEKESGARLFENILSILCILVNFALTQLLLL